MTLQDRIQQALVLIAQDVVALQTTRGALGALTTINKTSLVAALNEVKASLEDVVASGAGIDDTAGSGNTTSTWSANKIIAQINASIAALVNGAPAALDTLGEIADLLNDSTSGLGALLTAVGHKVDYTNAQALTSAEKATACTNIGIGDPDTDLAAYYTSAKA